MPSANPHQAIQPDGFTQASQLPFPAVFMANSTSEPFRIRHLILLVGQWCAVASLFVVPINKPATNVAIGLAVLCSLLGSDLKQRWSTAWQSPIARGALLWWGVLGLSFLHAWYLQQGRLPNLGTAFWAFLYPLFFASLLQTGQWWRRALMAFFLAMLLVLLISYGMAIGLIPERAVVSSVPDMRNTVFKEYTQQGIATLILGSIALAKSITSASRQAKLGFALLALLAFINVTLLIESRTSYIALIPLLAYWVYRLLRRSRLKRRHLAAIGVAALVAGVAIWELSPIQERLVVSVSQEISQYSKSRQPTSAGIRLELWRRTVRIIETAPWLGHGYGQWLPNYQRAVEHMPDSSAFMEGHPHQEMLLIASEEGLLGLLIYLLLLAALLRHMLRLAPPERDIYVCIFLVYITAGLGNCLWADFSHRHLFILLLASMPLLPRQKQIPRVPSEVAA